MLPNEAGLTAPQLRRRVLEEQAAAAGTGVVPLHVRALVDETFPLQAAVAKGTTQPPGMLVQEAYPGRRCQGCGGPPVDRELATHVRPTGTGGTDFYCVGHAPAGSSTTVRPTVAPE